MGFGVFILVAIRGLEPEYDHFLDDYLILIISSINFAS